MQYKWGTKSLAELATVDPDIKRVFDRALSFDLMDMAVIQGRRDKEEQDRYFYGKPQKSRVPWPKGKHNVLNPTDLAEAVDVAPVINGKISDNWRHCLVLAGIVLAAAKIEGVEIRWGGNWDMDGEPITDQDFQDLYHFEKVKK